MFGDGSRLLDKKSVIADGLLELKIRTDRQGRGLLDLYRRGGSNRTTPSPHEQQVKSDRCPVPVYIVDHKTLPKILNLFFPWALSQQYKDSPPSNPHNDFKIACGIGSRI